MKTIENARIRVSLPDEDWQGYVKDCGGDEVVARGRVLSDAMSMLAHAQEYRSWTPPVLTSADVYNWASRSYVVTYARRYWDGPDIEGNLNAWLHGYPDEMDSGFCTVLARGYREAVQFLTPARLDAAREEMLAQAEALERDYHRRRGTSRWDIQVIGDMPTQIGLCDYDPAGKHGALRCEEAMP